MKLKNLVAAITAASLVLGSFSITASADGDGSFEYGDRSNPTVVYEFPIDTANYSYSVELEADFSFAETPLTLGMSVEIAPEYTNGQEITLTDKSDSTKNITIRLSDVKLNGVSSPDGVFPAGIQNHDGRLVCGNYQKLHWSAIGTIDGDSGKPLLASSGSSYMFENVEETNQLANLVDNTVSVSFNGTPIVSGAVNAYEKVEEGYYSTVSTASFNEGNGLTNAQKQALKDAEEIRIVANSGTSSDTVTTRIMRDGAYEDYAAYIEYSVIDGEFVYAYVFPKDAFYNETSGGSYFETLTFVGGAPSSVKLQALSYPEKITYTPAKNTMLDSNTYYEYSLNLTAEFNFAEIKANDLYELTLEATSMNGAKLTITDKNDVTKTVDVRLSDVKLNGAEAGTGSYTFGTSSDVDRLIKGDYSKLTLTATGKVDGNDYSWMQGNWEPFLKKNLWGYKFDEVGETGQLANLKDSSMIMTINGETIYSEPVIAIESRKLIYTNAEEFETRVLNNYEGPNDAQKADAYSANLFKIRVKYTDKLKTSEVLSVYTDISQNALFALNAYRTKYVTVPAGTDEFEFYLDRRFFYAYPDEYINDYTMFEKLSVTRTKNANPNLSLYEIEIIPLHDDNPVQKPAEVKNPGSMSMNWTGEGVQYSVALSGQILFAKQSKNQLERVTIGATSMDGEKVTLTDGTHSIDVRLSDVKLNGAPAETGVYTFGLQNGKDCLVKQDYTCITWTATGTVDGSDYTWAHGNWEPFLRKYGWGHMFDEVGDTGMLAGLTTFINIGLSSGGSSYILRSETIEAKEICIKTVFSIENSPRSINDYRGLSLTEKAAIKGGEFFKVTATYDAPLDSDGVYKLSTDLSELNGNDMTVNVANGSTKVVFNADKSMFYKDDRYFSTLTVSNTSGTSSAKLIDIQLDVSGDVPEETTATTPTTSAPEPGETTVTSLVWSGEGQLYFVNLSGEFVFAKQSASALEEVSLVGLNSDNGSKLTLTDGMHTIDVRLTDVKLNGVSPIDGKFTFGLQNRNGMLVRGDYTKLTWSAVGRVDGSDYNWKHGNWESFLGEKSWSYNFGAVGDTNQLALLDSTKVQLSLKISGSEYEINSNPITAFEGSETVANNIGSSDRKTSFLNDDKGITDAQIAAVKDADSIKVTAVLEAPLSSNRFFKLSTDLSAASYEDKLVYFGAGTKELVFDAPKEMFVDNDTVFESINISEQGSSLAKIVKIVVEAIKEIPAETSAPTTSETEPTETEPTTSATTPEASATTPETSATTPETSVTTPPTSATTPETSVTTPPTSATTPPTSATTPPTSATTPPTSATTPPTSATTPKTSATTTPATTTTKAKTTTKSTKTTAEPKEDEPVSDLDTTVPVTTTTPPATTEKPVTEPAAVTTTEPPAATTPEKPIEVIDIADMPIEKAAEVIAEAAADESKNVEVAVNEETLTDASALINAVKGKDVDIILDCGDYSWTVNGSSVSEDISNMNLNVSFGTQNIPDEKVEEKMNDLGFDKEETVQLSLAHNGTLGFDGTLNYKADKSLAGKKVVIYYFNEESGEFEVSAVSEVDADGNILIAFSHASEYLLVMTDEFPEEAVEAVKSGTASIAKKLDVKKLIGIAPEELPKKEEPKSDDKATNPATGVVFGCLSGTALFGTISVVSFRKGKGKKSDRK